EDFCSGTGENAVHELDFGLGTAEYKELFANKSWEEAAVCIFDPTLKSLAIKGMRVTTMAADRLARKLFASAGLVARIKRVWRDHLAKDAAGDSPKSEAGSEV